jgi:hypothetical protein
MQPIEHRKKFGKFYLPRRPVCEKMCATCPFGVEAKFDAKLADFGEDLNTNVTCVADAQAMVEQGHEFLCHSTIDHDFEARTTTVPATAKMCKGALMYKRGEI